MIFLVKYELRKSGRGGKIYLIHPSLKISKFAWKKLIKKFLSLPQGERGGKRKLENKYTN
jgi:hypothetical protein